MNIEFIPINPNSEILKFQHTNFNQLDEIQKLEMLNMIIEFFSDLKIQVIKNNVKIH